jgi:hypothetical protein
VKEILAASDLIVVAIHAGLGNGGVWPPPSRRVPGDAIVRPTISSRRAARGGVCWCRMGAPLSSISSWKAAAGGLTDKRSRLVPAGKQVAADPEVSAWCTGRPEAISRRRCSIRLPIYLAPGRVRDNTWWTRSRCGCLPKPMCSAMFDLPRRTGHGRGSPLYPYDNELYAVEGDGRMVKAALENSARYYLSCRDALCAQGPLINRGVAGFNYDTAQGVTYEIDLTRPAGQRIQNLRWQGRPLLPAQKLRIAVNNYRAGGGGYDVFRGARVLWRSNEGVRDLIVRYFTGSRDLPLRPDDNWRVTPEGARRNLQAEVEKR